MNSRVRVWCCTCAILLAWGDAAARAQGAADRGLDLYFIDVEGGAATLLVSAEGESLLIDTGWPGQNDRDPRRIVHVLKDVARCRRLDNLAITHWHTDHYGGVAGLARLVEIGRYWDRGLPEDPGAGADFPDGPRPDDPMGRAYRAASKNKRTALHAGDLLPMKGLKAVVVASGGKVIAAPASRNTAETASAANPPANPLCASAPADLPVDGSDNARSLAFLFSYGEFQFFDAGDLTWNVEKTLVCPIDLIGPVDLYQVTHHGMDISNHPTLVRTLAPTVAIMNNGKAKGGAPGAVKLLRSIESIKAAYQLHRNASSSDDDNADPALIANKGATDGEFIMVRVAPGGLKFSVQIGEHGSAQTFAAK